jgi:hypothetical protein
MLRVVTRRWEAENASVKCTNMMGETLVGRRSPRHQSYWNVRGRTQQTLPHSCAPTSAINATHAASPAVSATRAAHVLAFLLVEEGLSSEMHERDEAMCCWVAVPLARFSLLNDAVGNSDQWDEKPYPNIFVMGLRKSNTSVKIVGDPIRALRSACHNTNCITYDALVCMRPMQACLCPSEAYALPPRTLHHRITRRCHVVRRDLS